VAATARSLLRRNAPEERPRRALGVVDPSGSLADAAREVNLMLEHFPEADRTKLVGDQATTSRVLQELPKVRIAHFAVHSGGEPMTHSGFGLALAQGDILNELRLRWVKCHADLIVLSACDTGLQSLTAVEEYVSLPDAFLTAGARGVIATQWPIEDDVTATLMGNFYTAFLERGQPPARALLEAQRTLRELRRGEKAPYAHPYYWAAYSYWGS
jgi:CHAT domain-containing protein